MSDDLPFKSILLKVSGEALMGDQGFGIDRSVIDRVSEEIAAVTSLGVRVAVVVGGGNIFRGADVQIADENRVAGHHMGMLATVMNCIALHDGLLEAGLDARVMSAIAMPEICDTFSQREAREAYDNGEVVLFAAGTGAPYFTTDTGAALRALEMDCDALFKGTNVDGIYTADPKKDDKAERFDKITHDEVIEKGLEVMDVAAVALAKQGNIPVVVFSIQTPGALFEIINGAGRCTIVR
ncbi:MAG: UMP kinase [Hyphomicrobiales bacterium]